MHHVCSAVLAGKGPQKEHYLAQLRELHFTHVAFRTLWLEAADYPLLLGALQQFGCASAKWLSSDGWDEFIARAAADKYSACDAHRTPGPFSHLVVVHICPMCQMQLYQYISVM